MSSPLILGILLASAAVTLATIVGWLMMAIAARWLLAGGGSSAPNRALLLAQARLLPLAAVAIVVPTQIHAFVSYEVGGTESAGFMLLGLGLSGILLCAGAAWRGFAACRDTARVAGVWKKTGIAMSIGRWPRTAWAVHVPFPVVAVVGALRPQLFVARQVVDTCTSDELAAIVAHEAAHVAARDNLVRLLFYITPGSGLCSRIGDPLERAWLAAAEEAADLAAGRLSGTLELASALTKVARLAAGHDSREHVDWRLRSALARRAPAASPRKLATPPSALASRHDRDRCRGHRPAAAICLPRARALRVARSPRLSSVLNYGSW
jgi:hypothetical protein